MALAYGDGARLGMVIGLVHKEWLDQGKQVFGLGVQGNSDEFVARVAYMHKVVMMCENAIYGAIAIKVPVKQFMLPVSGAIANDEKED